MQQFVPAWKDITDDPEVLDWVEYCHLEFIDDVSPVQEPDYKVIKLNDTESAIIDSEIVKLLNKGVIVEAPHSQGEFVSSIFLRLKKNGVDYRMILNLKELNKSIVYRHFKMDSLKTVTDLMTQGSFMASVDIKDAYYMVPIATERQKYLKFMWRDKLYQYTCLPNGLASAPRIFTKLLKLVFNVLRQKGYFKKTKLMLSGSKTMLSPFNDFQFSTDEGQIDRVSSFKYLGVLLDEKWKWKMHVNSLLQKLGHRLSVFNRIYHMLDQKSLTAYFNGLVLPHLDYADIVWGDQPGLTTQMKQLQSFQNRFAKKIVKSKVSSAEALTSLRWVSLHARRFGHRCCIVQDAIKGSIPEHFGVFRSTMNQQHGYNTRNGYMPKVTRPRTEWGKSKTYYKAINNWATLPSALKKLMPKTIFKYKLKQFLLHHF